MTTTELITAIRQTNNGYIFAPTAAELAAAKRNLQLFQLVHNSFGTISITMFPR
jgi:hypothetical protein